MTHTVRMATCCAMLILFGTSAYAGTVFVAPVFVEAFGEQQLS